MGGDKLVSVVIPTYNRADLIGQAIDSVLAQNYPAVEIIVADDGSTDETASVVGRYGERVRYLALSHRGQPAATRNSGIRAARGELIALLDSDDLYLPNKLALQAAVLQQRPEVGLVYSDGLYFRASANEPIGRVLDGLPRPSGSVFGDLLVGNFLAPPTVLIRRSSLEKVGLFNEDPTFFAVEDFDLWLRLAAQTRFAYVPGDVAAILRHPASISRDTASVRRGVLRVLAASDCQMPQQMHQHRAQRHEAYALSHGALAALAGRKRSWREAVYHSGLASWHLLHLPGLGLPALRAWRTRQRVRGDAAL